MATIYIIRHATPELSNSEIPYDEFPGPPLSQLGIQEASQLGNFFAAKRITKLYHSPFTRTRQTANIVGSIAKIPCIQENALTEWSKLESENNIVQRLSPVLDVCIRESAQLGPIGIVTHGGLIKVLLKMLNIKERILEMYLLMFDPKSPLPPAGVWAAEIENDISSTILHLAYVPT